MKKNTYFIFGASSGIGRSTAALLKNNNLEVKTFSRSGNIKRLDSHYTLDVKDPWMKVSETLNEAISDCRLSGIVYSVTEKFPKRNLLSHEEEHFYESIETSTIGLHKILRWASMLDSEYIDKKSGPSIVVLSSNSASSVSPYSGFLYSHSKASQLSLCRYYAEHFDDKGGWRFNVLTPGLVNTELSRIILGEEYLKTQQYIEPKDVANIIQGLLSIDAEKVSGKQIFIRKGNHLEYQDLYTNRG